MISISGWRPADGLTLEPNALKAATSTSGSLALTAGPGAGKTEMLAQRADFLLRTGTCPYPRRILAISFKVDASRNLKDRVLRRCGRDLATRFDSNTFHAFAKHLIDRFRQVLTGEDALDADFRIDTYRTPLKTITFKDIVPLAVDILRKSNLARNAIRNTYSDVFLDEFQDCTSDQYELIRLAFGGTYARLVAVGDTKQKIMGWAGALDGIFLTMAQDFKAVPLNMYMNFRSDPVLRRMQNKMVLRMDPPAALKDEEMVGDGGCVEVAAFESSEDEASYLSNMIEGWIVDGVYEPSDIAILTSKQPHLYALALTDRLAERGITYRNEQEIQDFSVEPIVSLLVDLLLSIYGSREPDAWMRLCERITLLSALDDRTLARVVGDARMRAPNEFTAGAIWAEVDLFIQVVEPNTLRSLSPDYEVGQRMDDLISELRLKIEPFCTSAETLMRHLHTFAKAEGVRILSIHKSKGLEFGAVIIIGIERQVFFGAEDAERCAFFVGISRAKHHLVLTSCDNRPVPSSATAKDRKYWKVSRTKYDEFLGYA